MKIYKVTTQNKETYHVLASDDKSAQEMADESSKVEFIDNLPNEHICEFSKQDIISTFDEIEIDTYLLPHLLAFYGFDMTMIIDKIANGTFDWKVRRMLQDFIDEADDEIPHNVLEKYTDDISNKLNNFELSEDSPHWLHKKLMEQVVEFNNSSSLKRLSIIEECLRHIFNRQKQDFIDDHNTMYN